MAKTNRKSKTAVVKSATGLNLRAKPDGKVLSVMPDGAEIQVFASKNGWANVLHGEQSGWAMLEYLSIQEEAK